LLTRIFAYFAIPVPEDSQDPSEKQVEDTDLSESYIRIHLRLPQDPITRRWRPRAPDAEWAILVSELFTEPVERPELLSPVPSDDEWSTDEEEQAPQEPAEPVGPQHTHNLWVRQQIEDLNTRVDNLSIA